jgi:hypothetical protein
MEEEPPSKKKKKKNAFQLPETGVVCAVAKGLSTHFFVHLLQ